MPTRPAFLTRREQQEIVLALVVSFLLAHTLAQEQVRVVEVLEELREERCL
jgi:hypothetical protein